METDERLAAVERVIVRQMLTIRPSHGGLLVPEPPVPALGDVVEKGRVLGRVYHPATFELLETIASPLDRSLMILQRETVTRVHPGDYAYMLGDLLTAEHADLGGD
jgi:predicted deacylase